jgi:IMP dehydrogenase/GMP reductase
MLGLIKLTGFTRSCCGNIERRGAKALWTAGADAVKVGIGRVHLNYTIIAGVGIPQLSAIYEVHKASKVSGIPIIADGGIRIRGIVNALLQVLTRYAGIFRRNEGLR